MCLSAVTLTRSIAGHYYQNTVPCNKCIECCKDQQNEYVIRTIEEQKKRGSMVFFTLTYAPENLPMKDIYEVDEDTGEIENEYQVRSLRRQDVRDWKRIFQERYRRKKRPLDYGFLICGEYGPRTKRPHYHGIFLGLDKDVVDEMMEYWRTHYGFVVYKWIPSLQADVERVARYCSKYIIKPEQWKLMPNPGCEKPRKMTSRYYGEPAPERWKSWINYYTCQDMFKYDLNNVYKIGKENVDRLLAEIIKRRRYNYNGKEWKLPNYYRRKIFYVKDTSGISGPKVRASQVQRLATYYVQCHADEVFTEQLNELATLHNLGTLAEAVPLYNAIQEDDKKSRAQRYEADMQRYYCRSVV